MFCLIMEIRNIQEKDLLECSILLEEAYSAEPYNEKFEEGDVSQYIKSKFHDCEDHSFVAIEDEKVIGFVFSNISQWAGGPQAIMEEIVVDKKYRGKGIAQKINQKIEEYFKSLNIFSAMGWTKKDSPAYKFHHKNGYHDANDIVVLFKNFK